MTAILTLISSSSSGTDSSSRNHGNHLDLMKSGIDMGGIRKGNGVRGKGGEKKRKREREKGVLEGEVERRAE